MLTLDAIFLEDDVSKTAISLASGFSSAHLSRVLMSLVVRKISKSPLFQLWGWIEKFTTPLALFYFC